MNPVYRVGVDGGGTKTDAVLMARETDVGAAAGAGITDAGRGTAAAAGAAGPGWREFARRTGPGCNPSIVGGEKAAAIVHQLIRELTGSLTAGGRPARIDATLLCMAGNRAFWREVGAGLTEAGRVNAVDDSLPVLELATDGGPGLVLHAGTGSFVAARSAHLSDQPFGDVHYAGGLGWRFGDPGSGYDLGREAVARGLLELQGWLAPSGLSGLLKQQTGLSDAGSISRYFYEDTVSNPKVSRLAPGVLELAARGDAAAREIVAASAIQLVKLALVVAEKLFPGVSPSALCAGLSGPILNQPFVRETLATQAPFQFKAILKAPIEGVKQLLARMPAAAP